MTEPDLSPSPHGDTRWLLALISVVGVLAVLCGVTLTVIAGRTEDQRDAAVDQSQSLAEQVRTACTTGGPAAEELIRVGACQFAAQVQATPTPGPAGTNGPAGPRGPAGLSGPAGPPGMPGLPGSPGPAGSPGEPGQNGADGAAGLDGADGVDGADGQDGADGRDGAPGPPGPACPPGESQQPVVWPDGRTGSACVTDPPPSSAPAPDTRGGVAGG